VGVKLNKYKKIYAIFLICCFTIGLFSSTITGLAIKTDKKILSEEENLSDLDNNEKDYNNDVIAYASFHWSPKYPDPGEKITFYSDSYAWYGYIYSEKWTFNDGHVEYGKIVTHTYDKKDSYWVKLEVKAYGYPSNQRRFDWDSTSHLIQVGADPFPKIKVLPENPSPGENVILDGSESNDPDGEIIAYNWSTYNENDPDNITLLGSEKTINYIWNKQGIFNVCLYVEDDLGNNNTNVKNIHVSILKLGYFVTYPNELDFKISNHGNFTAENVRWNLDINRDALLFIRFNFCDKNGTINTIDANNSENIAIKDLKNGFCKIKLVVSAEAYNAIIVSKTYYGLIFGKNIYLTEEDFTNPYRVLLLLGVTAALIFFILSAMN
jgi:hypothetical protein